MMRNKTRQTNLIEMINDITGQQSDWIDTPYWVFKVESKIEGRVIITEYSPKFLKPEQADKWLESHGQHLSQKFNRDLKRTKCLPSDNSRRYSVTWFEGVGGAKTEFTKLVPGEDVDDAIDFVNLFHPYSYDHLINKK